MSHNISSYSNNGQYVYQQTTTRNASGASGTSGASGMSGASGASSVTVTETIRLENIDISVIVDMFTTGNLTAGELQKWLNAPQNKTKVTDVKTETKDNVVTFSFKYNNKQYTIACAKDAAESQLDDKTQTLITAQELENMGFAKADIDKYFIKASDFGTVQYALKPDSKYTSIEKLAADVKAANLRKFEDTRNSLILQNF